MDIGMNCDEGTFKLRACGVVCCNGKILVDRARNFEGYVFIGGHISLGENSRDAILREAREELGANVEINKLICINENIYPIANSSRVAHEVAYYYLIESDAIPSENFDYEEMDNGKLIIHHYEWIDINNARRLNLRPNWVADFLIDGRENYYYLTDQKNNIYK